MASSEEQSAPPLPKAMPLLLDLPPLRRMPPPADDERFDNRLELSVSFKLPKPDNSAPVLEPILNLLKLKEASMSFSDGLGRADMGEGRMRSCRSLSPTKLAAEDRAEIPDASAPLCES